MKRVLISRLKSQTASIQWKEAAASVVLQQLAQLAMATAAATATTKATAATAAVAAVARVNRPQVKPCNCNSPEVASEWSNPDSAR